MTAQPQLSPLAAVASLLCCAAAAHVLLSFQPPVPDKSKRLGCLDGLRGFLALGVFFHHYAVSYYFHLTGVWALPPSRFYTLTGQAGVFIFFMITGFLFWHKLWAGKGHANWFKLYMSRVWRIVPLYWFALAVILLIVFGRGGASLKVPPLDLIKQLSTWLFFLGRPDINGFANTGGIWAYVIWTLQYEWVFYLALPLLALAIRWSKKVPVILYFLAGAIILAKIKPFKIPFTHLSTEYFIYFLMGAFAAVLYENGFLKDWVQKKVVSVLAGGCLILLFGFFHTADGLPAAILLGTFFIAVALGNSMFGILKLPVFIFLGEISYSIYLLHGILLYVLFSICFPAFFQPATSPFLIHIGVPLTGVLLVVISWLTYSFIEKFCMDLGRSKLQSKPR